MEKGERFSQKVFCSRCKRKTNHMVIESHCLKCSEKDGIDWSDDYMIVQCMGCDTVGFVQEEWNETMYNFDEDGEVNTYSEVTVYPEPPKTGLSSKKAIDKKDFYNVPEFLANLYSQVIDAYNSESYILSAVGLRSIIEGICKDLNVTTGYVLDESGEIKLDKDENQVRSKNLNGKINGLIEKSLIVAKQATVLHQVRELGNYAVHEIENPTRKPLRLGIEIIENILHNLYDLDQYNIAPKKKMASK